MVDTRSPHVGEIAMRSVWPLTVRGPEAMVLAIACFIVANESSDALGVPVHRGWRVSAIDAQRDLSSAGPNAIGRGVQHGFG
ncbi:hypothetical protein ACWKWN_03410 [Microbacterium trichothecenolyticum]